MSIQQREVMLQVYITVKMRTHTTGERGVVQREASTNQSFFQNHPFQYITNINEARLLPKHVLFQNARENV